MTFWWVYLHDSPPENWVLLRDSLEGANPFRTIKDTAIRMKAQRVEFSFASKFVFFPDASNGENVASPEISLRDFPPLLIGQGRYPG
jgi:hypothetical protein